MYRGSNSVFAPFMHDKYDAMERIKKYPQFGIAADIHSMSSGQFTILMASFEPKDITSDTEDEGTPNTSVPVADKFSVPKKSQTIIMIDKDTSNPVFKIKYENESKTFSLQTGTHELKSRGSTKESNSRQTLVSTSASYIIRHVKPHISAVHEKTDELEKHVVGRVFYYLEAQLGEIYFSSADWDGEAEMWVTKMAFGEATLDQVPEEYARQIRKERQKFLKEEESMNLRKSRVQEMIDRGVWVIKRYPHGFTVNASTFESRTGLHAIKVTARFSKSLTPTYFVKDLKELPDEIRDDVLVSLAMCKTHRQAVSPQTETVDAEGYIPTGDIVLPEYGAVSDYRGNSVTTFSPQIFIVSR